MAQFGCGGSRCTCQVVAGPGTTVTGNGSAAAPYVVSAGPAVVSCEDVRPCLSAGPGATYDPETGVIGAEPTLVEAGDNVSVTGTGAAGDPYVVSAEGADPTVVQAGDRVTVTGTGTAGDPYVVAADAPSCDDVRPCLSAGPGVEYDPDTGVISSPPTVVQAGTNVTVTGTGTGVDPYIVSAAGGGGGVDTFVTAGDRTTVTGAGTLEDPYVVSADPAACEDVRPCLEAGDGIDYDPDTGTITARPSEDAGNALGFGTDGGLLVPAAEPLETGCGLTGEGTTDAPLALNTAAWPYDCPPEESGTVVVCDADGVLRGEPRGRVSFVSYTETRNYADLPVPSGLTPTDVDVPFTTEVTNPDPCLPAIVLVEREADVDFNLPVGAGAGYAHDTDEMVYLENRGTALINDTHVQTTKLYQHTLALAPGATATINFPVRLSRGSGGATYNRIQVFIRALLISQ